MATTQVFVSLLRQLMSDPTIGGLIVPIAFALMIVVIVVPLPPMILDVFLAFNIAISIVILLTTMYTKEPLDFSVFPSLLLATTLMRRMRLQSSMIRIKLALAPPDADAPDAFTYDPMNPVPSYGGNVCCTGNAVQAGSFDQQKIESRQDVLVYTSEPFAEGTEVSGPIVPKLYVSSDAKDTDFTVKVLDVYPDGRAFNLDESIQRMRYRNGYDAPTAWMEKGKVYPVTFQPLTTSNYFAPGHRLRVEIASSNFPRFDRNLNTGGNNYDEARGVVARNVVHHSKEYPSSVTVTVVKQRRETSEGAR